MHWKELTLCQLKHGNSKPCQRDNMIFTADQSSCDNSLGDLQVPFLLFHQISEKTCDHILKFIPTVL